MLGNASYQSFEKLSALSEQLDAAQSEPSELPEKQRQYHTLYDNKLQNAVIREDDQRPSIQSAQDIKAKKDADPPVPLSDRARLTGIDPERAQSSGDHIAKKVKIHDTKYVVATESSQYVQDALIALKKQEEVLNQQLKTAQKSLWTRILLSIGIINPAVKKLWEKIGKNTAEQSVAELAQKNPIFVQSVTPSGSQKSAFQSTGFSRDPGFSMAVPLETKGRHIQEGIVKTFSLSDGSFLNTAQPTGSILKKPQLGD